MKAFHIDVTARTVAEVSYEGLDDMQKFVGGGIELAMRLVSGDVLFVDDEGLFKYHEFFVVPLGHQPFAGNGLVVGKERPNSARTYDPTTRLEDLRAAVRFFHRRDIQRMYGTA